MADRVFNVLFLCTGNTARSILAEGILRHHGAGRFNAFSAGSQPKGVVNPLALATLAAHGCLTEGLRSKSWNDLAEAGAPGMDCVLTVCDNAAGEACPLWPGQPISAHWGIADPAAVDGSDAERRQAFELAFRQLSERISAFIALPLAAASPSALRTSLTNIGHLDGATKGPLTFR